MKGLKGHAAIDRDKGRFRYDYEARLPFIVKGAISIDQAKKWQEAGKEVVVFDAPSINSLKLRDLPHGELDSIINSLEVVTDDLRALREEFSK